jgi:hypothetical protein
LPGGQRVQQPAANLLASASAESGGLKIGHARLVNQ